MEVKERQKNSPPCCTCQTPLKKEEKKNVYSGGVCSTVSRKTMGAVALSQFIWLYCTTARGEASRVQLHCNPVEDSVNVDKFTYLHGHYLTD
jgi:hypothetical protein